MSTPPENPNGRTVKPNGELCKQTRLAKGWDVSAMAAKTGLTKKTVESIEAGNRCFVFTLKAFSDVFEMPDVSQLLQDPHLMPAPITSGNRVQLKIKLALPFADCDFTQWLIGIINKLIKLIDPMGNIEVVAIAPGSIVITLEMDAPDVRKTVSAFGAGELADMDIDSMKTDFGTGNVMEFNAISGTSYDLEPDTTISPKPVPITQQKPEQSLLKRFSVWLFGEAPETFYPCPYEDKRSKVFSKIKRPKD